MANWIRAYAVDSAALCSLASLPMPSMKDRKFNDPKASIAVLFASCHTRIAYGNRTGQRRSNVFELDAHPNTNVRMRDAT